MTLTFREGGGGALILIGSRVLEFLFKSHSRFVSVDGESVLSCFVLFCFFLFHGTVNLELLFAVQVRLRSRYLLKMILFQTDCSGVLFETY